MQKSAKVIETINKLNISNNEIFYTREGKIYWYSPDLEHSVLVPGATKEFNIYVHNNKLYYNNSVKFVEFNAITCITRELCDRIIDISNVEFEYPYFTTHNTFINVETGVVLASPEMLKMVKIHKNDLVAVVNITSMNDKGGKNAVEYTITLHDVTGFKKLYTSEVKKTTTSIRTHPDDNRYMALVDVCRDTRVRFINSNTVVIDNDLIKVREKSATKPRCAVCHKKLTVCGVAMPCKHHSFHYECIGTKCPECGVDVTDKINTAI